ncbi:hypothetical protein MK851_14505 [Tenacibaculum sp. 1B UA]|uniref:hypothetical protein n=1 Tax=Tenacibaculum sp. 1B UA TaxID=2922252 RepID=UPI002A244BBB|nr:hypothetical protein [Tenacibaculum sp. 1B UA]MDX8554826.1 hypothetical protein [Tenacibaculum sp. 1B UA]
MKKLTIVIICLLMSNYLFSQQVNIKYNVNNHTLSGKLNRASISSVIKELSKQNFLLFIVGDNKNFSVTGQLANTSVDRALSEIIPSNIKYFYKIDSKEGEINMVSKTTNNLVSLKNSKLLLLKQANDKNKNIDKNKPKLGVSTSLLQVKKINTFKNIRKVKDPFKPKNARFSGTTAMGKSGGIKPASSRSIRKIDNLSPELSLQNKKNRVSKKHLVVTYKITNNGMTPVSKTEVEGSYSLPTEESGNWAIIGLDGNNTVLAETFENPLSYRTIFDPKKSDHKEFTANEAYVSVKMPIKYKSKIASEKLDLKLVKFKDVSNAKNVLQKVKRKQLRKSDLNTSFQILKTAPKADFSKLKKITNQ